MISLKNTADLRTQAETFSETIQTLFKRVLGGDDIDLDVINYKAGRAVIIRLTNDNGVGLTIDGRRLLRLSFFYNCSRLTSHSYMRVEKSSIRVFAVTGQNFTPLKDGSGRLIRTDNLAPLFRYGYVRKQRSSDLPGSHIHFYGYNRGLEDLLLGTLSGKSAKAKNKRNAFILSGRYPHPEDLHFPTGGARFRPGLEDVLEMLITEFDVDHTDGALEAIRQSREAFRLSQIKTLIREFPDLAFDELSRPEHHLQISGERPTRREHIASLERY